MPLFPCTLSNEKPPLRAEAQYREKEPNALVPGATYRATAPFGDNARHPMKRPHFDKLVQEALERIPKQFRDAMENVQIIVEDWPDPELMEEVTGDPDGIVYGLFTGTPITERRFDDWGGLPAMIHLYRGPLIEDFPEREELVREIEVTLAHEIAHFMGFDEAILANYGYD